MGGFKSEVRRAYDMSVDVSKDFARGFESKAFSGVMIDAVYGGFRGRRRPRPPFPPVA
jgi:hypothetical protein